MINSYAQINNDQINDEREASDSQCLNYTWTEGDCFDLFNCCDCGFEEGDEDYCGCAYCFSCNACENCLAE